jgi:hypothetical protein
MIDADGAYHAYHPDGRSGLDLSRQCCRPGNWWTLVTDNNQPNGTPVVQTGADPAPGFTFRRHRWKIRIVIGKDPRGHVNAQGVNFVVLPGRLGLGAKLGDFAVMTRPATGATYCDRLKTRAIRELFVDVLFRL